MVRLEFAPGRADERLGDGEFVSCGREKSQDISDFRGRERGPGSPRIVRDKAVPAPGCSCGVTGPIANHFSLIKSRRESGSRPRTWARARQRSAPGRGCGPRSCRRRCSWCRCNRRRWSRSPAAFTWRLDFYSHWGACLKEANCRVNNLRRLIGIKPEIIKRAPANGVGVFVGRKRFAVPGNGCVARDVIVAPRRVAISLVVLRAVECPAGMLGRSVKPDVSNIHSRS
jgi:hypothetical protein